MTFFYLFQFSAQKKHNIPANSTHNMATCLISSFQRGPTQSQESSHGSYPSTRKPLTCTTTWKASKQGQSEAVNRYVTTGAYMHQHFYYPPCRRWILHDLTNYLVWGTVLESPTSCLQDPPTRLEWGLHIKKYLDAIGSQRTWLQFLLAKFIELSNVAYCT